MKINEPYKIKEKRDLFLKILEEGYKSDARCLIDSVLTCDEGCFDPEDYKNIETLIIYNKNEAAFAKNSTRRVARKLGVKPFVADAFDHRHFTFQFEKSADAVTKFLLSH